MTDFIIYLLGFIITVPVLATWIVYVISLKIYRHRWQAFHTAVNWTTIFYIFAVYVMFDKFFGNTLTGITLILLISTFTIIVIAHWEMYTEIIFSKVFKIFWRVCFLLFLVLYMALVFLGIIQRIFF